MLPPLVVTKYTRPAGKAQQVVRGRLLDRLLVGLPRKLTLIAAPPGFGKSTLAAEFARVAGRAAAWLSLDEADNDPERWGAYLTAAVRATGLPLGDPMESLLRFAGSPPLEALVAALINAVAASGSPLLLILDDYHVIHADPIHAAVGLLLDRLPPNLHLVIVTRTRPPLPLARLKVRGELAEITAADLRFSAAEAAAFLHAVMGLDLPAEGVAALVSRTEGWVAGLQLAALSLQGAADWRTASAAFSGGHPDLLNYLVDEVLHQQPADVRAFLLQTAILDRLTGPLCDVVTGLSESHRRLAALEQANLFLVALDPERRWYRYHSLFAEFLLDRLRDEVGEPGVAELHRRAAQWYHADGQLAAAVDHLVLAGAFEQAAQWLEDELPAQFAHGSLVTVRRWVDQLPPSVILGRPRLATLAAWVLIAGGDVQADPLFNQAAEYLDRAARALGRLDQSQGDVREALGVLAAVRTALAAWAPLHQLPICRLQDVAYAVQGAEQARQLLPAHSLEWRAVVSSSLGSVFLRVGDVSGAAQAFGEAARLGTRSGNRMAAAAALQRHAQLLTALGRLGAAEAAYQEALRLAAELGGETLPTLAPIYLGLARLRYEWNDLAGAARRLEEARTRYAAGGDAPPELLLALARASQAQGDAATARTYVDQAGDLLRARSRLRALETAVWPEGVRLLLALGDVTGARRWVAAGGVAADGGPELWRAPEYLALARVLVAEEEAAAALPLLGALRAVASAGGCRAVEAEAWLVEALARHATGDARAALGCVRAALALTAQEGFVRLFADGGPVIIDLLGQVADDRQAEAPSRAYARRLLAILGAPPAVTATRSPVPVDPLVEPLTEREREILGLLAVGCSNQEVARELIMGVSTVKWHLLNLYGKLQVKNRTQAVARARALGLV